MIVVDAGHRAATRNLVTLKHASIANLRYVRSVDRRRLEICNIFCANGADHHHSTHYTPSNPNQVKDESWDRMEQPKVEDKKKKICLAMYCLPSHNKFMFCKDCHNKGKYEGYITTKQGKHIVVSNKNQRSTNNHNPKTRNRSYQEVKNGNETVTFTTSLSARNNC